MSENKQSIFDIGDEIDKIARAFDEVEELAKDDASELLRPVLDGYFADLGKALDKRDAKIDGYCRFMQNQLDQAAAIREEEKRLAQRRQVTENRVERLKAWLKLYLESEGITKIQTTLYTVVIQANGGMLPLVTPEVINFENLPAFAYDLVPRLNAQAVRDALQQNLEDDGLTKLGFSLGERGTHLRIR